VQPVAVTLYVIVTIPEPAPVTMPVEDPTVATDVALLLHVPPNVASVKVVVALVQTVDAPPIVAGRAFTVTVLIAMQPAEVVYVIIGLPAVTPVTTPFDEPTVANDVLPLLHAPPDVPSVSVVVELAQTVAVPPIAAGFALTVTVASS
jgi:hypothetical protein